MKPPEDRTGKIVIVGRGEHLFEQLRALNPQLAADLHARSDADDVLDQVKLIADADPGVAATFDWAERKRR